MDKQLSRVVSIPHRIRYSHCDRMGILYHVNHLDFVEWGRTEWIRTNFVPYKELEDSGLAIVVVEASLRYLKPAYYDEQIEIRTSLLEHSFTRFKFTYDLFSIDRDVTFCNAETAHCFINRDGKPVRISKELHEIFQHVTQT